MEETETPSVGIVITEIKKLLENTWCKKLSLRKSMSKARAVISGIRKFQAQERTKLEIKNPNSWSKALQIEN